MGQGYLIDTNVIIDNFGNKLPEKAKVLLNSFEPVISAVTKIEVLGWPHATKQQLKPLYAFMEIASILPIDEAVIEKTIAIRQDKKVPLGDAIIAGTALVHNLTLVSRNISDFKDITNLRILNPYTL
jgi:predicted nucleic acid-binding protein